MNSPRSLDVVQTYAQHHARLEDRNIHTRGDRIEVSGHDQVKYLPQPILPKEYVLQYPEMPRELSSTIFTTAQTIKTYISVIYGNDLIQLPMYYKNLNRSRYAVKQFFKIEIPCLDSVENEEIEGEKELLENIPLQPV